MSNAIGSSRESNSSRIGSVTCAWYRYRVFLNIFIRVFEILLPDGFAISYHAQGRIKAGADEAAAPGPQPKIGPPLFLINKMIKELR